MDRSSSSFRVFFGDVGSPGTARRSGSVFGRVGAPFWRGFDALLDDIYVHANMSPAFAAMPDVFRAFADPMRLRLLNLLVEREVCVCDLCAVLGETQPKVSRHLAYLRRARLVAVRQVGRWRHYRIANHPPGLERTLIDGVRGWLRGVDLARRDVQRLRATGRACCE